MTVTDRSQLAAIQQQRSTNAVWIAETIAGQIRQQTGRTVDAVAGEAIPIVIELDAELMARLAAHEQSASRLAKLAAG